MVTLKFSILKKLKQQLSNARRGKGTSVYRALKSLLSPYGNTFKAVEIAAGCMMRQYGYRAYSISGEFEVGKKFQP